MALWCPGERILIRPTQDTRSPLSATRSRLASRGHPLFRHPPQAHRHVQTTTPPPTPAAKKLADTQSVTQCTREAASKIAAVLADEWLEATQAPNESKASGKANKEDTIDTDLHHSKLHRIKSPTPPPPASGHQLATDLHRQAMGELATYPAKGSSPLRNFGSSDRVPSEL
jgi:hypothetical protein